LGGSSHAGSSGLESGECRGYAERADVARHDGATDARINRDRDELDPNHGRELRSQTRANRRLPRYNFVAVRHTEITTMPTNRREFLRKSACALGGVALASSLESFGIVQALTPQSATDYKALVCVFLNGGNDGNNMFVSLDQYTDYSAARSA